MNRKTILAVLAAVALGACASGQKSAVLHADSTWAGGPDTVAKISVPADWYRSSARGGSQVFVAPDNFSRVNFEATPILAGAERCPMLAQRAAERAAAAQTRGKRVKVDLSTAAESPEVVDFSMTVPGTPPGPSDRVVVGRAICRDGALATVACSASVPRQSTAGRTCETIVASLVIEPAGQQPAAAPAPVEPAPEQPAAPAEPAPEQPAAPAEPAPEQPAAPAEPAAEQPAAEPAPAQP